MKKNKKDITPTVCKILYSIWITIHVFGFLASYIGVQNVYDTCMPIGMIYIIFADIIIVAVMIYDRYEKDFIVKFIILLIVVFFSVYFPYLTVFN